MLRGIYNAAYAMEVATRNHEIVSENLVNATTPGYRRQGLVYEASAAALLPATAGSPAPVPSTPGGLNTYLHLESGPLQQTSNQLDFAIDGPAFFVVQGPNGPLYTRNGAFELGPGGDLRRAAAATPSTATAAPSPCRSTPRPSPWRRTAP